ncbi:MAG: helix-turn-helix domain-containing protein [Emcibacteraceae bacterium]|nr:helix-turn-helix domain-containing protein [Emcibacteraceae bacterium]
MSILLNENQASEYLGKISIKTLQRWRIEGRPLKFVKLGKAVRYRQEDLDKFINDNIKESTTDA